MLDEILKKFSAEENLIIEYHGWIVLFRVPQVTLGSLVLIYSEKDATSLGDISEYSFAKLPGLLEIIESFFREQLGAEKFNYLALMMLDPQPHFHFFPRYPKSGKFLGENYEDISWPGPIDITTSSSVNYDSKKEIISSLKAFIRLQENNKSL